MFLRVRIHAIDDNGITVALPNGTQMTWSYPRKAQGRPAPGQIGDEMILTLTRDFDIINELLTDETNATTSSPPQQNSNNQP